jgi:acetyl-CoA carboxylase carboxyltransferase component
VPDNGPYDMRAVIEGIVDAGSAFEVRPNFATSLITAFGRMDGRSVGIIANQPAAANGGAINPNAADKIARFVQLCDSYGLPIVSLIDTPGTTCLLEDGSEVPGLTRHHARALRALHHRAAPLFAVQLRRGGGVATAAMSGIGSGRTLPQLRLAWPSVVIDTGDRYYQGFDDVIEPGETRDRILAVLRMLPREIPPTKTRPRDSW